MLNRVKLKSSFLCMMQPFVPYHDHIRTRVSFAALLVPKHAWTKFFPEENLKIRT